MFRSIAALLAFLLIAGCHSTHRLKPSAPATQPLTQTSPHAEAITLIAQQRSDRIKALDGGDWWTDTMDRTWVVQRTESPGIFDTTHNFDVEYQVGGRIAARWSVDTRAKMIADQPKPEEDFYSESE